MNHTKPVRKLGVQYLAELLAALNPLLHADEYIVWEADYKNEAVFAWGIGSTAQSACCDTVTVQDDGTIEAYSDEGHTVQWLNWDTYFTEMVTAQRNSVFQP